MGSFRFLIIHKNLWLYGSSLSRFTLSPQTSAIRLVGDCIMLFGLLFKIALNTVRTEIIGNDARTSRILGFGLVDKTRREDSPSALTWDTDLTRKGNSNVLARSSIIPASTVPQTVIGSVNRKFGRWDIYGAIGPPPWHEPIVPNVPNFQIECFCYKIFLSPGKKLPIETLRWCGLLPVVPICSNLGSPPPN